jgi:hypothetical protein
MPPKPRQRRKQREVSAHMEHSQAESAVNAQNLPSPPPSDPNPEAPPTNLLLELIQSLQQNQSELAEAIKHWGVKKALPNDKGKIITFRIIVPILGAISSKNNKISQSFMLISRSHCGLQLCPYDCCGSIHDLIFDTGFIYDVNLIYNMNFFCVGSLA